MRESMRRLPPIGDELSFTKYFYKPVQLRPVADIRAIEKSTEGLLEKIISD